jgi:ribosomal protein L29
MNTNELARERVQDQLDILGGIATMLDQTVANLKYRLLELRRDGYTSDLVITQRQARREITRLLAAVATIETAMGAPAVQLEAAE